MLHARGVGAEALVGGPLGAARGGTLALGVVPTFANRWLLPRLGGFRQQHPNVTINLTARTRPFLFDDTLLDAAIHAGEAS